jgi:hypothetical protein
METINKRAGSRREKRIKLKDFVLREKSISIFTAVISRLLQQQTEIYCGSALMDIE